MAEIDNTFWAITSFFNPMGAERRLANYRAFRQALDLPLLTVEWSWAQGKGLCLNADDAEILIQISGTDLLWQKERLLNVAIKALPKNCRYVAWVDCDVIFENPRWHECAAAQLQVYPLVQPYDTCINLGPDGQPLPPGKVGGQVKRSLANHTVRASISNALRHEFRGMSIGCGHAWAGRTELLREHTLYDACVIGSGDRAIFCAAIGRFDDVAAYMRMNSQRLSHYKKWAVPFYADVDGHIDSVYGQLRHLWHGSIIDRKYEDRHIAFEAYDFDPVRDTTIHREGYWQWATHKPEMHAFLVDYFVNRNEDGELVHRIEQRE